MSSYMSKFHKSLVCKFTKISIDPINNSRPSTKTSADAQEGTKANHDRSDEKRRRKRSRKCTISKLTGCGCQSKRGIVLDRIPDDSQMPEACSVQSIPSCTSSLESEWISSSATFDEMLKVLSSSSNSNHKEVHHIQESSIEKNSLEMLHISNLKFNDLVNKLRKSEQISTTTLHSHKPLGFSNELVECKVEEKRLISNNREEEEEEEDRMTESLLIMKSSRDPRREFKESMMEMIVENKIKDGKDMEELLACFLYLNSEDYHDVIIQVFKQLWAELIQV